VLRDLEPGTQYWYRIGDFETRRFSTPDVKNSALRFAVASDTHIAARENRKDLTAAMVARIGARDGRYDLFFSLGDLVQFGFRGSEWDEAFATLSPATSVVPAVFVPGNHDTLFGLRDFSDYCYPPGTACDSKGGVELWRRIDVGNVHFLVLDVEWSAETVTAEQIAWLESQLQSIPVGEWRIVMNHGFYYCSGVAQHGWQWWDNPETIARVTPLFEKYGVNLVFSGHAHQMEVLEKSGVTYVITGPFGGRPDPERTYVSPASVWYASGMEGFVGVSLSGDQARLTFTGPDGGEINHFVVAKTGMAGQ
jgi:3',5'-cyclic AMP phosphodiesterase CpdA